MTQRIQITPPGPKAQALLERDAKVLLLEELQARHPNIGQVRGRGLMIGVEFVRDRKTKEPHPELRHHIVNRCFEHDLLTLGCGRSTIRFMPALMIGKDLVDEGLEISESVVTECEQGK